MENQTENQVEKTEITNNVVNELNKELILKDERIEYQALMISSLRGKLTKAEEEIKKLKGILISNL